MLASADKAFVTDYLARSVAALSDFAGDEAQSSLLGQMSAAIVGAMRSGGKLLIAGNGGSAGDAQHIAAEFTGRMLYDRDPLSAMALHVDTSALTAVGNDYGFEKVFERQVLALGRAGDVLLGISTSGNSPNVIRAMETARSRGLTVFGFTGAAGGAMMAQADLLLHAPSSFTPIIQQIHITAGHLLCSLVERAMFPKNI